MYEMVTGKVPFDADTPVSVALKHMQEEPEEPIELNKHVPTAVNKIIMKALQKDTTLRYQSASEMLVDLRKSLKNPDGDFVEENEYDPTAKTQRLSTEMYENFRDNPDDKKKKKKDNKFVAFIKRHKVLSIIVGLILLFALSLGGTLLVLNITNPPEVAMPNVVGLSREEAQKQIEDANLVFEVSSEEYNKDVEAGHVISQDPSYMEGYNSVKEGSTVSVVISKGQETTTVPKVVGMEQEEAIKALEEANLKAEVVEETSRRVEEGIVISQETEADSEAYAGDTVKIHVSIGTGIEQVTVVSVVGQDEATAKSTLENLGLTVTISYQTATSDNGKVIAQSIDANRTVDKGSTITLTVNKVAETKSLTVNINVKAITGGYEENENTTSENNESPNVNITVNSERRTGISKNESNYSVSLSGKDGESTEVKVTITDAGTGEELYSSTQNVTFGSQTSVSFK